MAKTISSTNTSLFFIANSEEPINPNLGFVPDSDSTRCPYWKSDEGIFYQETPGSHRLSRSDALWYLLKAEKRYRRLQNRSPPVLWWLGQFVQITSPEYHFRPDPSEYPRQVHRFLSRTFLPDHLFSSASGHRISVLRSIVQSLALF